MTTSMLPQLPPTLRLAVILLSTSLLAWGCGGGEGAPPRAAGEGGTVRPAPGDTPGHAHAAPHGGLLVELGDEWAHLEFVLDSATGALTAYVLDGEARDAVRLTEGRLNLRMLDLVPGDVEAFVVLAGKDSPLTGETREHTSVFVAFVPELKGRADFRAVIERVVVRGQEFRDIPVTYPGQRPGT